MDTADEHGCVVISGGVKCWGYNTYGQQGDGTLNTKYYADWVSGLGSGSGVTRVFTGSDYACALQSGALKCWGKREWGKLADGVTKGADSSLGGMANGWEQDNRT